MEQFITDICAKTGIDRATAEKIAAYLKDNLTNLPALLQEKEGGLKGVVGSVKSKVGEVLGRH